MYLTTITSVILFKCESVEWILYLLNFVGDVNENIRSHGNQRYW